jgi:hypothetical protein
MYTLLASYKINEGRQSNALWLSEAIENCKIGQQHGAIFDPAKIG